MKPFNLAAAKNGAPIITRDGRPAKFIGHFPENFPADRICYIVGNCIKSGTDSGKWWDNEQESDLDLFMAATKKDGWTPLYRSSIQYKFLAYAGNIYATKEQAEEYGRQSPAFIQVVHISWEE